MSRTLIWASDYHMKTAWQNLVAFDILLLWQALPVNPGKQLQTPLNLSHSPAFEHSVGWWAISVEYALSAQAAPVGQFPTLVGSKKFSSRQFDLLVEQSAAPPFQPGKQVHWFATPQIPCPEHEWGHFERQGWSWIVNRISKQTSILACDEIAQYKNQFRLISSCTILGTNFPWVP